MAGFGVLAAGLTASAAGPDDTWAPAAALPDRLDSPVFALAVNPAEGRQVLAGAATAAGGAIYRSGDGGATWQPVRAGLGHGVAVLAFDPRRPGVALAGTRGAGIWRSADGGLSWQSQPGAEGRTVRAFGFVGDVALAGGDRGVLASRAGGPWAASGLAQVRVSALAVLATEGGHLVVAGGDATQGSEPLPLFASADTGASWDPVAGVTGVSGVVGGSSAVAALAAQPGPAGAQLLMGTNTGLYGSPDAGASWQQLAGGGSLPATDVSALAVSPRHPERLYVASDGGASDQGGLWATGDGGGHFSSLDPAQPEVTALAASGDDATTLVVATFRPADHAVAVWTYRDAGGRPQAPAPPPASAPPALGPAAAAGPAAAGGWRSFLLAPETPYVAFGLCAFLVVLVGLAANASRRRLR